RFRMQRKVDPLDLYVETLSQLFNTPGTEVTPRSNEIGKDLDWDGFICHVLSMAQVWKFSAKHCPGRLYLKLFPKGLKGPHIAFFVLPVRRVYENRKRQLRSTEHASQWNILADCRYCSCSRGRNRMVVLPVPEQTQ